MPFYALSPKPLSPLQASLADSFVDLVSQAVIAIADIRYVLRGTACTRRTGACWTIHAGFCMMAKARACIPAQAHASLLLLLAF